MSVDTPMAETQSAPSLRELSEAVPQCEWKASGRYIGTANHMSLIGECRDENGNWSDTKISTAKAAFVARLASDYFASRLIDPTTLAEAVASARAEGWQPIETAPRNFTSVLVAVPSIYDDEPMIVGEAYFDFEHDGGAWWWSGTSHRNGYDSPITETNAAPPTHWMPLPAPPTTPGGRTDG